jgi:hypothetical protein
LEDNKSIEAQAKEIIVSKAIALTSIISKTSNNDDNNITVEQSNYLLPVDSDPLPTGTFGKLQICGPSVAF